MNILCARSACPVWRDPSVSLYFYNCISRVLLDRIPAAPDSQKILFSVIMDPVKTLGDSGMALEYTEEKLNGLD